MSLGQVYMTNWSIHVHLANASGVVNNLAMKSHEISQVRHHETGQFQLYSVHHNMRHGRATLPGSVQIQPGHCLKSQVGVNNPGDLVRFVAEGAIRLGLPNPPDPWWQPS